jgi:hypothetical protein
MAIPNQPQNDDEVDWIDFDPKNDPGIKKVKTTKRSFGVNYGGAGDDGCVWLMGLGFLLCILFVVFAALFRG